MTERIKECFGSYTLSVSGDVMKILLWYDEVQKCLHAHITKLCWNKKKMLNLIVHKIHEKCV